METKGIQHLWVPVVLVGGETTVKEKGEMKKKKLSNVDVMTLAWVMYYDGLELGCIASNREFRKKLGISLPTLERCFAKLENAELIIRDIKENGKGYERKIRLTEKCPRWERKNAKKTEKVHEQKNEDEQINDDEQMPKKEKSKNLMIVK